MKRLVWDKRFSGILWAVIPGAAFILLSRIIGNFVHGVPWYLLSSMLRAAFGIIILMLGTRLYGKTTREILSLHNSKIAILSGLGFLVFLLCYVAAVYVGCRGISGLTAGLFFARILLQQLTTALYEELNYRFLILEGYFHGNKSVWSRLLYAFVSFLVFGAAHVVTGWSTSAFFLSGAIGFTFAVIYLKSGNIVIPMLLHFIYDIPTNMTSYIEWKDASLLASMNSVLEIALAIMFLVSLVILIIDKSTVETKHTAS